METKKINSYLLVFTDGDAFTIRAETLIEAIRSAGKKFNMLGLARFSVNGGPYQEIIIEERSCGCFQSKNPRIPCQCALNEAEQQAAA